MRAAQRNFAPQISEHAGPVSDGLGLRPTLRRRPLLQLFEGGGGQAGLGEDAAEGAQRDFAGVARNDDDAGAVSIDA